MRQDAFGIYAAEIHTHIGGVAKVSEDDSRVMKGNDESERSKVTEQIRLESHGSR